MISCYISEETKIILEMAAFETGRTIENLAEAAIENAAIEF